MLTPLSSFRPIFPLSGGPFPGASPLAPNAGPLSANTPFGMGDIFERGGRGDLAMPASPCGGAGQAPNIDIAQLVRTLIGAMQQQGVGSPCGATAAPAMPAPVMPDAGACGGAAPAGGLPFADPTSIAAMLGPQMADPGRALGTLGGSPWGNIAPLINSPLSGLNGIAQTPPNGLAAQALNFSAAQMNPATANAVNPNTGVSQAQNPDAWSNWCLAFVSAAYGYQVPELRAGTAFQSYQNFAAEGRIAQDRNPPPGAPVFFNQTAATPYGHVGIATGKTTADGDPIIRTTGSPGAGGIFEVPLSQLEKLTAGYLGWARI